MTYDRHWHIAGLAAGTWCIAVGLGMMTIWLAEPVGLAERYPMVFGMKFNAALAFLVLGTGFLLTFRGYRLFPALLMIPVFVYGALALSQHVFGIDAGIDNLIYRPFVQIGTSLPGRIAPNTALCFLLLSAAVALRALSGRNSLPQALLGFVGFIIGATALIGYAISFKFAHDWIAYTRMSLQSASCFTVMATAIIFVDARQAGYHRMVLAAALAGATYAILLLLTYVELHQREKRLDALFAETSRDAESTLSVLVLISGTIYGGLIVFSFWNSRRSRIMAAKLAESEGRLAAIIGNAVDGIIAIDRRGTMLSTNPACQAIFGYAQDEMVGRNVSMLMPEPYHSAHDGYLANYRRSGEAKIIGIGREVEGRRKDGSVFPLDLAVAKIELAGGVIYSGIVRDISERKRYETELLAANAELEEFAYRTSHDLRSPIASSLGLLTIARTMLREGDQAGLEDALSRMEKNYRRLDHLIQSIIVLTRNRLLDEEKQPIRVHDLVRQTLDSFSHLDHFSRIAINNLVDGELTIVTKPSRFQIVVGNMLSNAVKYHDASEPLPRIDIRAEKAGGGVRISVEDNGIGVPAQNRHLLFQMFKRLHPNRSFGSGLGLYIMKKTAEAMGGTAAYEPMEKGSRFTIELPDGDGQ